MIQIFYITMSEALNGIVRDEHRYISVAILGNDEQNCTTETSDWSGCNVTYGTGMNVKWTTTVYKDDETGEITCQNSTETKYCQVANSYYNIL